MQQIYDIYTVRIVYLSSQCLTLVKRILSNLLSVANILIPMHG
jgi:hypothetical protein